MTKTLLFALAMFAALPRVHAATPDFTRPNLVIIFTDDQGCADVGKSGAKGFTPPNFDRMADQGAIFRNFHGAQPVCLNQQPDPKQ